MLDPLESFRLDGKVAVVTGASSGLGVVFAETLAGAGAKVVVSARRLDHLEKLAEELRRDGAEAMAVQCDVLDESDIDRLVTTAVDEFGSLDIMVANAGLSDPRPAEDEPLDVWHRIVGINLTGVFLCAQRAGRVMLDQGSGSIVNVASVLGQVGAGQVPQASYSASKGGVVNLTRELAAQWARRGVRVNSLSPGWFHTEMTDEMFEAESGLRWIRRNTPMGRAGEPRELAGALLYLASDASSYVTGQVITVDGGWTAV